ncbi:hypothetical protein Q9Q94_03640 [Uliginosibacterium sp. 31-16]|uniref:hypothetical protein n=1 Tax=Uliginosibacterium sp. 31-16 TaxID=3068315 RepID=UPI00273F1266|nr:hypothetical protein [Uliginosibacterium sp. 31-16]MDP5238603.1 hypothetical protein [Uliginosibacterium sp. 31-16]
MYCIVFSGRLLDGYDPQVVRKAVASRLSLDAKQVERLFCGERMVLKKGVTEDSGRLYLDVLRRLGLDAGMARIPRSADTVQALATFKVVFWGRILDGFQRDAVMRAAAARLKAAPAQLERMFNGSKAVLKRGVSSDVGSRYVVELARIGMQIDLEVETVERVAELPAIEQIVVPVTAPAVPASQRPAGFRRHGDESYSALLQTQFELPDTSDYAEGIFPQPVANVSSAVAASSYDAPLRKTESLSHRSQPQPPRSSKPIVVPTPAAASVDYVRCDQCGHRQTSSSRCRVCGTEMKRSQPRPHIPMDASAYATPTTVLGNMPPALMRNSVATSAPSGRSRDELRTAMSRMQTTPERRQARMHGYAPTMIGIALAITLALWLFW